MQAGCRPGAGRAQAGRRPGAGRAQAGRRPGAGPRTPTRKLDFTQDQDLGSLLVLSTRPPLSTPWSRHDARRRLRGRLLQARGYVVDTGGKARDVGGGGTRGRDAVVNLQEHGGNVVAPALKCFHNANPCWTSDV